MIFKKILNAATTLTIEKFATKMESSEKNMSKIIESGWLVDRETLR